MGTPHGPLSPSVFSADSVARAAVTALASHYRQHLCALAGPLWSAVGTGYLEGCVTRPLRDTLPYQYHGVTGAAASGAQNEWRKNAQYHPPPLPQQRPDQDPCSPPARARLSSPSLVTSPAQLSRSAQRLSSHISSCAIIWLKTSLCDSCGPAIVRTDWFENLDGDEGSGRCCACGDAICTSPTS